MPAAQESFTINETNQANIAKAPYLWSARMTYAVCAFLSMVLHHCMRSAVNISILCMVASKNNTSMNVSDVDYEEIEACKAMNGNISDVPAVKAFGDLEWSRNESVMFQGIFYYGYILTLPIGGLLADRYGGKVLFVYSILIEALLFMLLPVCARSSFWLAGFVRFWQGFIAGFGQPALYQLFSIWAHPTERTAALAFGYSGFNVGNLIVYPLCSFLCKFGWDYVYYVIGGGSLLIGLNFQFFIFNTLESHPRISIKEYEYLKSGQSPKIMKVKIPWVSIFKCVPVYVFILTHFCHTFGVSMIALMLSRYLKEAMYFPLRNVGNIASLIFLSALISKITTMFVGIKIDAMNINHNKFRKLVHLITNLSAVALITVIVFLTCRSRWIVVMLWTFISLLTDVAFALAYWPSIMSLAPSHSGFLIGTANCFGTTSSFLVPIIITKVVPQGTPTEWQHVLIIMAGVYTLDALAFGLFGSSVLQPWGLKKNEENTPNEANSQNKSK